MFTYEQIGGAKHKSPKRKSARKSPKRRVSPKKSLVVSPAQEAWRQAVGGAMKRRSLSPARRQAGGSPSVSLDRARKILREYYAKHGSLSGLRQRLSAQRPTAQAGGAKRKSPRKSGRKSGRKSPRKSPRKSGRKSPRKSGRKSPRKTRKSPVRRSPLRFLGF